MTHLDLYSEIPSAHCTHINLCSVPSPSLSLPALYSQGHLHLDDPFKFNLCQREPNTLLPKADAPASLPCSMTLCFTD